MKYLIKTLPNLLILGLLLTSCSNDEKIPNAETAEHEQDIPEFEVVFPKTRFEVKESESNSMDMPTVTNWLLEGKDENGPFMYFVAHNKLSKDLENLIKGETERDLALQGMLTGSAEKLGGHDFEFTKTNYKGHPGMASKCKVFDGDGMIKSVVYLIDQNFFVISGGGKQINEVTLDKFLASFKLK